MHGKIKIFNKKKHNRKNFDCSNDLLTNYLKRQVSQDINRKLSVCFVLTENETEDIFGYYTLSNNSIPLHKFPGEIKKKLPKTYSSIPTTLLGRLAIDKSHQGEGLGKMLLIDALKRSFSISGKLGSFAVVVDPIDKGAEQFYKKYGFIKLPDSGKMFIAMKTLKVLFRDKC